MEAKYQIIIILFVIGCLCSIRFGWVLSRNYFTQKLTKELRKEAVERFQKEFFDRFVIEFEERVETRAFEMASIMFEEYKKELEEDAESDNH
jgi:histone H3/H4